MKKIILLVVLLLVLGVVFLAVYRGGSEPGQAETVPGDATQATTESVTETAAPSDAEEEDELPLVPAATETQPTEETATPAETEPTETADSSDSNEDELPMVPA